MNESVYKRNRTFFGSPYRITHEQEENPVSVFHSFFDFMHLYQVREVMEELKEAILLSTKDFSLDERMDTLYVLERIEEFVEAGFVIARKDIEAAKQKQVDEVDFSSMVFENELHFYEDEFEINSMETLT
jgi:hypothetical protein